MIPKKAIKSEHHLHEEKREIQICIYEEVERSPFKTYGSLGEEFDLPKSTVRKMLVDYCDEFNLPNPKQKGYSRDERIAAKHYLKGNKTKGDIGVGEKIEVEGRLATIEKEYTNTYLVCFENELEKYIVKKTTHEKMKRSKF